MESSTNAGPVIRLAWKNLAAACRAGAVVTFLQELLDHVDLQVPLGQQTLQTRVLLLQLPEPLDVRLGHRPVPPLPRVVRRAVAAGLLKNGVAVRGTDVFIEVTVSGAICAGLAIGAALGLFNGITITWFKLPPFVATLGMLSIARGLTMLWTGGFPVTRLGESFDFIGSGHVLGVPMPVWISAAIVVVFVVLMRRTRFGRHVYAVGGNERAAVLSGLNVNRVKVMVYVIGGALAGVAGILVTARLDSATPNAGMSYELDSIAAVVIGGTSLNGGRGSVVGTVLGCLIIGVLNNGLVLLEVSPFWQQVIKGLVILIAVAVDRVGERRD